MNRKISESGRNLILRTEFERLVVSQEAVCAMEFVKYLVYYCVLACVCVCVPNVLGGRNAYRGHVTYNSRLCKWRCYLSWWPWLLSYLQIAQNSVDLLYSVNISRYLTQTKNGRLLSLHCSFVLCSLVIVHNKLKITPDFLNVVHGIWIFQD